MSEPARARRYLDGPPRVVVTGDERRDALATRLGDELAEFAVETAETVDDVVATLAEDVAAVVTTGDRPGSVVDLAERVAERDPPPSVVVFAREAGPELARATAHGSVTVRPVSGDDPDGWAVAGTVREAGTDYLLGLGRALESDALDALFSGTGAAFFLKDDEGRYLRLGPGPDDPSESAVLGETEREVRRRVDLSETWHEGDRRVIESGEPDHRRPSEAGVDDGLAFETTRVPWRDDDGDLRGLVGYRRRLDDQQARAEELARRTDRLEAFVDDVSHDLRNPLLVADGYLELAREGDEAALDRVEAALDRIAELIDDAAELAQSRAGGTGLERTDLREVVDSMWDVAGDPATDATLEADVAPGTTVDAPEAELRMLFENLFVNAMDHGSTDGESVTVRVGTLDGGFFVEDDGPGIPESIRDDVTDRGFTTTEDGTGVGLAVVSGVADSNDWRFAIAESGLPWGDPGARFEFRDVMFVTDETDPTPVGDPLSLTESADVGEVTVPGESVHNPGADRWTVTGEGVNVYLDQIGFHYRYATVDGDVRIEGALRGVADVYPFSKGGFMLRESLDPGASHGFVGRIASGESEVLWATDPGAPTRSQQFGNPNEPFERFRLDREGPLVTASVRHGDAWVPVDQRRVSLGDRVLVGLVVCSVTPGETCSATFEDVTVRRLDAEGDADRP
jgi:signal transduction histidine kinase